METSGRMCGKLHKKGLELCKKYYEAYGRAMIHEAFPEYEARIAVGMVGEGSDCFGFDDSWSEDHDFGPAFCMWLLPDDMEKIGKALQEAYEALPASFEGFAVRRDSRMSGQRTGVWSVNGFYQHFLGTEKAPEDLLYWLQLPEHYLATASNGAVFRDDAGVFSGIRNTLKKGYPEDVRIKKMVARAAVMSQAGQYNYPRCIKRGENVAAELALAEFMRNAMSMIYLLNHCYAPFYKWMHRGLSELPLLSELALDFRELVLTDIGKIKKIETIEKICAAVVGELQHQNVIADPDPFLQVHLDEMMAQIRDERLRSLHWLQG